MNIKTPIKIPKIIYGTAWKKDTTADLVEKALQTGFLGIDTACQPKHYNEALVGDGLGRILASGIPRSALFIQTKFTGINGQDPQNIPYDPKAPIAQQVIQSFERSLKNLKTDYIDSWVLHGPLSSFENTMEAWHAMEKLCDGKKVKQLGISNFYDPFYFDQFIESAGIKPTVLQNRFYKQTGYDVKIRRKCKALGIIYQSFWTLTANPQILGSEQMSQICNKLGKSPAQILFRYLSEKGIVPLTGTTDIQHMKDDLEAMNFTMEKEIISILDEIVPH